MRRALIRLLLEDHRSIAKRSCKRRDSNERPSYQNVRFLLSLVAFFFDWSQSHCLSLHALLGAPRERLPLRLVFPFLTSFYGNDGTKFWQRAEGRLSPSSNSPAKRRNSENQGRTSWVSLLPGFIPGFQ